MGGSPQKMRRQGPNGQCPAPGVQDCGCHIPVTASSLETVKECSEHPREGCTWYRQLPAHREEAHSTSCERGRTHGRRGLQVPSSLLTHLPACLSLEAAERELPEDPMRHVPVCTGSVADSPWIKALKFKCSSAWLQYFSLEKAPNHFYNSAHLSHLEKNTVKYLYTLKNAIL